MPETRPSIKLDFISGLEALPPRPKVDSSTTHASVIAGREMGFTGRTDNTRVDGRSLRSKGAKVQLNLKVTEEEKAAILRAAQHLIDDPDSRVSSIGEFVVHAVEQFRVRGLNR